MNLKHRLQRFHTRRAVKKKLNIILPQNRYASERTYPKAPHPTPYNFDRKEIFPITCHHSIFNIFSKP